MKWDVDFQCFVIRGGGVSRGRQAGFEQVSSGCNGYISSVLFVDGGFCVDNQLWGFQAASSCIEYMASVQGSGHGNGNGRLHAEKARSMPRTFNSAP